MRTLFHENERLGIYLPNLDKDWDEYTLKEQGEIVSFWEKERAKIPDRIKELEEILIVKTKELLIENDEQKMIELNNEVIYYASIVNDLNIWFRIEPSITEDSETTVRRQHM